MAYLKIYGYLRGYFLYVRLQREIVEEILGL